MYISGTGLPLTVMVCGATNSTPFCRDTLKVPLPFRYRFLNIFQPRSFSGRLSSPLTRFPSKLTYTLPFAHVLVLAAGDQGIDLVGRQCQWRGGMAGADGFLELVKALLELVQVGC